MNTWIDDAAAEIANYGPLCTVADIKRVIRTHYENATQTQTTELAGIDKAVKQAQETLFKE
jgi:hypothetical protein